MRSLSSIVLLLIIGGTPVCGQLSEGGYPPGFEHSSKSQVIPTEVMPVFDIQPLLEEDAYVDHLPGYPTRFSKNFNVQYNIAQSGAWTILPDGSRLWKLAIHSPGAYSIHLVFSEYILPKGARLFVYNENRDHILGAFTSRNNKPWGRLAVAPVKGETIIVEYHEPSVVEFHGKLAIGTVGHAYRNLAGTQDGYFGNSESCNKDVNCSIASGWQVEKQAVCRIIYTTLSGNSYLCSGSLINNTRNDGTPFFLTANHCIPTYYEAQTAIFYFNYESPTCNGPDGSIAQSISGAFLRATTNNLDFSLVEISDTVHLSFEPYFAGWDVRPDPPASGVGIHHPEGDVKKISFYYQPPITGDFIYEFAFDDSTHWYLESWSLGITQGGSSGSPMFNQNHHIVGDLTGGSVIGNCTSADAYYAKLYHSWNDYPNKAEQLKYWLDPDTSGLTTLNGYGPTGLGLSKIIQRSTELRVFPNPSQGQITLDLGILPVSEYRIEVFNIFGSKVFEARSEKYENECRLDLGALMEGIYLVRLSNGRDFWHARVELLR